MGNTKSSSKRSAKKNKMDKPDKERHGHESFDNHIEDFMNSYYGHQNIEPIGEMRLNLQKGGWRCHHKVELLDPNEISHSDITESVSKKDKIQTLEEVIKITINMDKSWQLGHTGPTPFRSTVYCDVPQEYRIVRNKNESNSGVPDKIDFSHIGKTERVAKSSIDVETSSTGLKFEKKIIEGTVKVLTYFTGEVYVEQETETHMVDLPFDFEQLLLSDVVDRDEPLMKQEVIGQGEKWCFESTGTFRFEIKRRV